MSKQKYTVVYQKPWEEEKKRTRFASLKITKQREKRMSERGWRCKIISKNDYPHKVDPKDPTIVRKDNNIINHWKFIPKHNGELLCVKNGNSVPIERAVY